MNFLSRMMLLWLLLSSWLVLAQTEIVIEQDRGVDSRVDYSELTKYGPWDDRNYNVTLEDLAYLPPGEEKVDVNIPAWARIIFRKAYPNSKKTGDAQYPRHLDVVYIIKYGGFLYNGRYYQVGHDELSADKEKKLLRVPVSNERSISNFVGAAESAIAVNPANPNQVIAGANNINVPGGGVSETLFSTDGGDTFTTVPVFNQANTNGDPTVAWSADGSWAYQAALLDCGFFTVCAIGFYRSSDGGQTWTSDNFVQIVDDSADKQYLHVDIAEKSPFRDRLYLTWHENTTMVFAKSTNMGATWDSPIRFTGEPRGIGSDITTDANGNVYYLYPGLDGNRGIWLLKSTNGGASFGDAQQIAVNNDSFDYPIPSFDNRNAFIYVAADTDRTGGTYDGSVYAVWSDLTATESSAANNHSVIRFAYSRDGGDNWTEVTPHSTDDVQTVDRYNPWMEVDSDGVIHMIFYDTRNSPDRTGNDLYYTNSQDGGQSFVPPERLTSETSPKINDNFEWGDYNGMTIVNNEKILPVWTDNRDNVRVFTADVTPEAGDCTSSTLAVSFAANVTLCSGSEVSLMPNVSGGQGDYRYAWTPAAGLSSTTSANPVASPNESTIYMLTVTDDLGCEASAMVTVTVVSDLVSVVSDWCCGFTQGTDLNSDNRNDIRDGVLQINTCGAD